MVDALVQRGDEGRGELRNASGSCKQALIRGYPNGETRHTSSCDTSYGRGEPGEVNHLSTQRKRNQLRFPE
jgi:hypothetical protein